MQTLIEVVSACFGTLLLVISVIASVVSGVHLSEMHKNDDAYDAETKKFWQFVLKSAILIVFVATGCIAIAITLSIIS